MHARMQRLAVMSSQSQPSQTATNSPPSATTIPPKRTRSAVVCRRCKSRKQKCSGKHPAPCSNCIHSGSTCNYDITPLPPHIRTQYLRAVRRVQELEELACKAGLLDEPSAEWLQPDALVASAGIAVPSKKARHTHQRGGDASHFEDVEQKESGFGSPASTDSFVDVLRDLSIEAAGGYVDDTATISMGRMFDTLLQAQESSLLKSGRFFDNLLSPKSAESLPSAIARRESLSSLDGIPDGVAERMLYGYFRHIYTLWPIFPTSFVRGLHSRRAYIKDGFEVAALNLIYGCGGRYLETTGETGNFRSEEHYAAAVTLLEHVLQLHDIRSVQILLLFAIYGLRAPRGPGAWSFAGLAMRTCIELGLHRRNRSSSDSSAPEMLRRCVFWSCYCLDRQISIILGRPFAISDRDIDIALPTGVENVGEQTVNHVANESSTLECFTHIFRLRRIESHIQQTIYRVDQPCVSVIDLEDCLQRLETWKSDVPRDSINDTSASINRSDYYMVYYYKSLRYLLHPHVSSPSPQQRYLHKCVEACGGICQTYKRLHQNVTVGFSLMALHSVFFAGLTLLYCSWVCPKDIFTIKAISHMNACSIVLHIIAERWPGAKKYRDIFEALKQSVMESIDDEDYEPRRMIKKLKPDVHEALKTMQPTEACQEDFAGMLATMTGGVAPSDDASTQNAAVVTSPTIADASFFETISTDNMLSTTDTYGEDQIPWLDMPWSDDRMANTQTVPTDTDNEEFSWLL